MSKTTGWILTIAAAVVTGCLLVGIVAGLIALYGGFSRSAWGYRSSELTPKPATGREGLRGYSFESRPYASNGERIYYTGINERGQRIPFEGGPMWLYMHGGAEAPPLEAGTVIAVGNCGLYLGNFGVRVEDTVVVNEEGPVILTLYERQLL